MVEIIALVLLIPLLFLTMLALVGNPEGFWLLGPVGVQAILAVLGIIGIIGVLDVLQGVAILGGVTGLALMVVPFLY